jgi:AcrR family transcriptional regulator
MDTREALLRAAGQLFAERGFAGTGTREIAERASANQALIRYHFGGKDGLWREVVGRGLSAVEAALGGLEAPIHDAERRVDALLSVLAAHAELLRVILHGLLEPGPRRDWLLAERLGPLCTRGERWLLHGSATPPPHPSFLSMWLAAAVAPIAFSAWVAGPHPAGAAEVQRAQREALLPFLQGGALTLRAGPWSLAEVRRRAATGWT